MRPGPQTAAEATSSTLEKEVGPLVTAAMVKPLRVALVYGHAIHVLVYRRHDQTCLCVREKGSFTYGQ